MTGDSVGGRGGAGERDLESIPRFVVRARCLFSHQRALSLVTSRSHDV